LLQEPQMRIGTAACQQVGVRAALDDAAVTSTTI
jgi:hypothetical protein